MAAVYAAGITIKNAVSKKCVKNIFTILKRHKNSRFLGYYMHKLRTPDFREREAKYRQNVLRALEEIPTLEERIADLNAPDPVLDARVDIGFSNNRKKNAVSLKERLKWRKSFIRTGEKEGGSEKIDLARVQEEWFLQEGATHFKNIADHYGVFSHLYDCGYFTPCIYLKISYDYDSESTNPVCMGNILQASDATKTPDVNFKSKPDDLWTLVLTNLDGHLLDTSSEYLHWFIGNIKGNDIKSGDVVCDYLRPFPMRGSGYHRLVFVLYKQTEKIDFSPHNRKVPCLSLEDRTFKTYDFYKEYQDFLTPAGLSFFQCTWDESLTDFFHNVLNMQEPVFEYIQPPLYIKPQVHYPHKEPFNLYLDRYRDPKEMSKEVLLKRLKIVEPFKEEAPMKKYPLLHKPDNYRYSWQAQDMKRERLRLGRYRDLRPHSVYPQEDNQFQYVTKA